MIQLWKVVATIAFVAIISGLPYLVSTHHLAINLRVWSWLSIQFSLSWNIQEHMRHWLVSSGLLLSVQYPFPDITLSTLCQTSFSDTVGFCFRVPALHVEFFFFFHKMRSRLLTIWKQDVSVNIINHRFINQRAMVHPEQWPLASRRTASSPAASSCVLVSLPQWDLWWDSRSIMASNGESVPRCRTIFSPSRQKGVQFPHHGASEQPFSTRSRYVVTWLGGRLPVWQTCDAER